MIQTEIQFAVVREDPTVEAELLRRIPAEKVLMIASGGCTALSLQTEFPDLQLSLFDLNPAQIALVKQKVNCLEACNQQPSKELLQLFNVGGSHNTGLSQCGNFEKLFQNLRNFIQEFVCTKEDLAILLGAAEASQTSNHVSHGLPEINHASRTMQLEAIFNNPYWPIAFQLIFSDPLLNTMFGPDATQHAEPGSYPRYFQQVFERGLSAANAEDNYFLHHILLGHYVNRPTAMPNFLIEPSAEYHFDYHLGAIEQVPQLERFDMIDLSNIMDWMDEASIASLADTLCSNIKPGARILWRQLNNQKNLCEFFEPSFSFNSALAKELHQSARCMFYSSLHIGTKEDINRR